MFRKRRLDAIVRLYLFRRKGSPTRHDRHWIERLDTYMAQQHGALFWPYHVLRWLSAIWAGVAMCILALDSPMIASAIIGGVLSGIVSFAASFAARSGHTNP